MASDFFWILEDFIKWSPLVMLGFGALGLLITRKKSKRVKIVSVAGGILVPILGMLGVLDLIYITALAGETFGKDFGFTERFDVPLHNNYQWTAMDSTDIAIIYNIVGTDGGDLSLISEDFSDVLKIQEQGDWLAGSHWSNSSEDEIPGGYFLFNTRTGQRIAAKSEQELRVDAAGKGIQLNLQSCHDFYLSRHFNWIALLEIVLLLALPIIGLGLLWRLAVKFVRKGRKAIKASH